MSTINREFSRTSLEDLCLELQKNTSIDASRYKTEVKRGLRNADGSGVMAGLTKICNVHGYVMNEGEKAP
ncbi:MAG: citrate synthase, partial [Clostridia bacterium]|nr:citrate synthase [Clostridia bacterium]